MEIKTFAGTASSVSSNIKSFLERTPCDVFNILSTSHTNDEVIFIVEYKESRRR